MNYEFYDDVNMMNNVVPYNNGYSNYLNNKELKIFNPYEGFLKGNIFKDEYIPYKNYQPGNLKIQNEQEEMMINIGQYSFMLHDLNLYLDVHPNDQEALYKLNEYRNKTNELITIYERKYGPLTIKGNIKNDVPFDWEEKGFPWVK